jgi:large subunit ribosomal protein L21
MYAIIKTGGKQYRVEPGDVIDIETVAGSPEDQIDFDEVLAVSDGENVTFGTPVVDGAKVSARLVDNHRAKKIVVFKKKRRKGYAKKQGHRQNMSRIEILEIQA